MPELGDAVATTRTEAEKDRGREGAARARHVHGRVGNG